MNPLPDKFKTPHYGIFGNDAQRDSLMTQRLYALYNLPAAEVVLNVGSSWGWFCGLYPHDAAIINIDLPHDEVDYKKDNERFLRSKETYTNFRITHIAKDIMDASLDDESVDLVVAGELIEHLLPEAVVPFFEKMQRVLKPGGHLYLDTPNAIARGTLGAKVFPNPGHKREYTAAEVKAMLAETDLTIKSEYLFSCYGHPDYLVGFLCVKGEIRIV